VRAVLDTAAALEELARGGVSCKVFETGLGVSIFRDNSTRTRYAFRSGCNLLGLMTEELDESSSQIAHGETVRETAAMLGFLTEVVGIRDDMFLGEGDKYQREVAAALDESHKEGVLMQRPAVINLQSDLDHPTQSMADLAHLVEVFGGIENLKGKKLAMSWAHSPSYGKPLSVPQGVITLMTRFGMDVVLAYPPGYDLVGDTLETASRFAKASGGSFAVTDSMAAAFENADVVYPKSWAPAAVMRERTRILHSGEKDKLKELEREALASNARHTDWECTEAMMRGTKGGAVHALPAGRRHRRFVRRRRGEQGRLREGARRHVPRGGPQAVHRGGVDPADAVRRPNGSGEAAGEGREAPQGGVARRVRTARRPKRSPPPARRP